MAEGCPRVSDQIYLEKRKAILNRKDVNNFRNLLYKN